MGTWNSKSIFKIFSGFIEFGFRWQPAQSNNRQTHHHNVQTAREHTGSHHCFWRPISQPAHRCNFARNLAKYQIARPPWAPSFCVPCAKARLRTVFACRRAVGLTVCGRRPPNTKNPTTANTKTSQSKHNTALTSSNEPLPTRKCRTKSSSCC